MTMTLSARETEVLRLIALGYTSAEAAAELGVSTRTIDAHRSNIQTKLDRHTRRELVAYALEHGLIRPTDYDN